MAQNVKNATNVAQELLEKTGEAAAKATTGAVEKTGYLKDITNDSIIIILVIIAMIVIILITIYIVRMFKKSNMKETNLVTSIIKLHDKANIPLNIPAGKLATSNRGQEFTYSFWIYLGEYSTTSQHKLLIQRGSPDPKEQVSKLSFNANPIIALDKGTNMMWFALSTTKTTGENSLDDIFNKNASCLVSKIEYVPLHRWVFISMVLRDNIMTIYLDGDIYSVTTTSDIVGSSSGNSVRPIVNSTYGDAFIGSSKHFTTSFISKLNSYNFALTQNEILKKYNQGPVNKSILSVFGLANYGVRNPVYNLQNKDENN